MRKPCVNSCRFNPAILFAAYALGLISSYILPAAAVVVILSLGLLILGICRIKF